MVWIFVLRDLLYFSMVPHARGSIWIVLTPHSSAKSSVSKTFASVL